MNRNNNIKSIKKNRPFKKGLIWENIYFVGIGGIGMSAIARYFNAVNKRVAGYDKTKTNITDALENNGININFEDAVKTIETPFLDSEKTLVVYTPAISKENAQLKYFRTNNFNILKRSEILGLITENTFCLAVAGTHGKTTTTSILGYLMKECNVPLTAFLGGISENYNSNLILNGSEVSVVEADEFDRSFLTLSPNLACITSLDADHLDIYGDEETLVETFKSFSKKLKPNGKLFVKNGLPLNGITYGIEDDSNYSIQNITIKNGAYFFDIKTPKTVLKKVQFNLPGRHNLLNALVAFAMALEYGLPADKLIKTLANYKGVKRRFTYQIKTDTLVFIDDYAHHPTEINAVHQAVREMYPEDKVLAIFQPHLFSRTKDFAAEFAQSLSQFDEILLLDIYPARELPIEGINSKWLLEQISNPKKELINKSKIIDKIKESNAKIILTIGAGDIGAEVQKIKKALVNEN